MTIGTTETDPVKFLKLSAIQEWEILCRSYGREAEELLDKLGTLFRIWDENELANIVGQTDDGAFVGDSTYTKETCYAVYAMIASLQAWATTPIPGIEVTPRRIMSTRRPPTLPS